ncbi:hypothetical protein GJ633_03955 [Halorubrum sp. CBA1125]|uniref:DUF6663 family protein n=1 Tax=Halorubrum sp. CBA1125 TaxID=2668072 RepID=UPI0012E917D8|nr:DUF6663 family protein [Halorubrum sp. CBA1125]MUW13905.1 hypothetical protein [Halorubrum sp. CBA1125]
MDPTTSGRFRVHDRRPRPDIDATANEADGGADTAKTADTDGPIGADGPAGSDRPAGADEWTEPVDPREEDEPSGSDDPPEEFVLVEIPDGSVDPTAPGAAERYDPLYATAEAYEGDLAERVAALEPGYVVDATLAWTDGSARFVDVDVVRETRFRFADDVEGMFEAAVEAWRAVRAEGEAVGSVTTRSNDGDPNGALYLFADAPGSDTFADLRAGRLPIEPLVARVNASRADDDPREVFVLRPAAHEFVAVYVVFDRDGVLAQTVRDTYGLGSGFVAGLDAREVEALDADRGDGADTHVDESRGNGDNDHDDFDPLDRV